MNNQSAKDRFIEKYSISMTEWQRVEFARQFESVIAEEVAKALEPERAAIADHDPTTGAPTTTRMTGDEGE